MFLEPSFMLAPVGTMFSHQFPELLRVIHLFQVGKLVDYDVVNDRLRCHCQPPVEAKVALLGAATPASSLSSYDKSVIPDS